METETKGLEGLSALQGNETVTAPALSLIHI